MEVNHRLPFRRLPSAVEIDTLANVSSIISLRRRTLAHNQAFLAAQSICDCRSLSLSSRDAVNGSQIFCDYTTP